MSQERTAFRFAWVAAVVCGLVALTVRFTAHIDTRDSHAVAATIAPSPRTAEARPVYSDEERQRRVRALHRAQLQLYAETFDRETIDASWASSAESGIRSVIDRAKRSLKHTRVQCKSTLCRVDLGYEQPKDGQAFCSAC